MKVFAFDTETTLIRPGRVAPPMACLTFATVGKAPGIAVGVEALRIIRANLLDTETLLVGHNVAFDFAVIAEQWPELTPLVFAAYKAGRVTDTMLRQQLLDIASGVFRRKIEKDGKKTAYRYDLETLARRCAGIYLQKDAWRLSYGEFVGVDLSRWLDKARDVQAKAKDTLAALMAAPPPKADKKTVKAWTERCKGLREMIASEPEQCLRYPLEDARATLAVFEAQEKHVAFLADQYNQAYAYWALYLSSAWGLRTDAEGASALEAATLANIEELRSVLEESGLVKADGSRDTKAAAARMLVVCRRDGRTIIRTDAHYEGNGTCDGADDCDEHVCLDGDACESSEDPILIKYAEYSTEKKILANDVKAITGGLKWPLHTRYGLAGTGRTTSSNPNIQNQNSKKEGIREAFVPRPGWLFAQCDYPQLELYTLAQCCVSWLGQSRLAEVLLANEDPHLTVASTILGISYKEAKANKARADVKRARALAKIANFGFAGGLGPRTAVEYARGLYTLEAFRALDFTQAKAKELRELWFATYPEMRKYLARAEELCGERDDGLATAVTLFTNRWRGGATFCATCNNGFQALGSDCAKKAATLLAEAEYVDTCSPLYGCRTVAFVHDEFIVEVPKLGWAADEAARELARLMALGANTYLPDVPIALEKLEPVLMRRWSKAATPTFDTAGRLIPWMPEEKQAA